MKARLHFTLNQAFALSLLALALLLGGLFYVILQRSREVLITSAERLRFMASERIRVDVEQYLGQARAHLNTAEHRLRSTNVDAADPAAVEAVLFGEALANPALAEVTFTHGRKSGYDADGEMVIAPGERWQVSVYRADARPDSPLFTRRTSGRAGVFTADERRRERGAALLDAPFMKVPGNAEDPTTHATFTTTSCSRFYGQVLPTDLHRSQLDEALPEKERRVVITFMKAVEDRAGDFLGVLRVGLALKQLEFVRAIRVGTSEGGGGDDHEVFLCDQQGRLVLKLSPKDEVKEVGEDLRVVPVDPPPQVVEALRHPALARTEQEPTTSGDFRLDGRRYLVTFRELPTTQGWRVGIVAPEDAYLGPLQSARRQLLLFALGVFGIILLGGVLTLRAVQGGLGAISTSTARMSDFDFAPAEPRTAFRDVEAVMARLEKAKTALRAMGKYVPVDLVRLLYRANREPVLGGELRDVTVLFTDVKDFTTLSEQLSPNELAPLLGRYLEVMTDAVHAGQGIIDKYIGDAVMALWNVPNEVPDHAVQACRTALRCVAATEALFAAPEWQGRPRLVTRFGLHRDEVMVGHFGAPDRMSYTALGDGVNLASRLEGLNKQYGTTILVSEAVYAPTRDAFAYRLLDVVAVKGKTQGVKVYELLGEKGAESPAAAHYEQALQAYWRRDFAGALCLLEAAAEDAPSAKLAERCRAFLEDPPPADWDGTYVSRSK